MASRSKDLLEAAAGERSLPSAVGRWMRAVAEELGLAVAGTSPQYAYGKGINAQNNVGVNSNIEFDGVGLVNGIPRSPGNPDAWLLTAGKVYVLRAGGYFDTFSDATGGNLRVQWVDDNNNALQSDTVDCPNAVFAPTTNTGAQSSAALVEIIYRAPATSAGQVVKVRVTAATGTASKPQSVWWASLVEIPIAA